MNKSGGFARTSRYAVVITPPTNLASLAAEMIQTGPAGLSSVYANPMAAKMQQMSKSFGQQVNLHCSTVAMPGHDLQAQDVQHGSAPGRQMVQSHDYNGTIAASFYLDDHLRERHFFEMWMKMAVSIDTHKASYYDDYIGTMEIYQLDGDGQITYAMKAIEVYPTTMAGIEYAYANTNQIAIQSVNFQYRQWFNMTSDAIAKQAVFATLEASNRQKEKDKQRNILNVIKDVDTNQYLIKEKQEQSRQRMLRPPEIDIDRHAANRKSAKRDEQLKPPTSSSKVSSMNRDAIAKGLGQKSVAALKTALRNKSKGL